MGTYQCKKCDAPITSYTKKTLSCRKHSYIKHGMDYGSIKKICYDCDSTKKVLRNSYSLGNCRHIYKFKIWCC